MCPDSYRYSVLQRNKLGAEQFQAGFPVFHWEARPSPTPTDATALAMISTSCWKTSCRLSSKLVSPCLGFLSEQFLLQPWTHVRN